MSHAEFVDCVHQLRLNGFFAFSGVILIIGAFRRWKWIVDPPLSWAPIYSQAAIKEKMGTTFLLYFTYFLGLVFLVFGSYGVYQAVLLFHQLSTPPPHWVRPTS
jgi:hypothetical protein